MAPQTDHKRLSEAEGEQMEMGAGHFNWMWGFEKRLACLSVRFFTSDALHTSSAVRAIGFRVSIRVLSTILD